MMATYISLEEAEDFIREKIEKERWTHQRLLMYLKYRFPTERGLSHRSLERLEIPLVMHCVLIYIYHVFFVFLARACLYISKEAIDND